MRRHVVTMVSWLLFIFSSFEFPATQKIKTLKVVLMQYMQYKGANKYNCIQKGNILIMFCDRQKEK